jgi:carbamoyltransferase
MKIFGINYFGHDSSAALVIDGKVVSAVEEERFSRIKHDGAFPNQSINYCLENSQLSLSDIDAVALTFIPEDWINGNFLAYSQEFFPDSSPLMQSKIKLLQLYLDFENHVRKQFKYDGPIVFKQHHKCHFASSYYLSGFADSALMSMDGSGEYQTMLLGYGQELKLKDLQETLLPHSMGYLYDAVSVYLGFNYKTGAGKVMGLASYGDPERYKDVFEQIVTLDPTNGTFHLDMSYFEFHKCRDVWVSDKLIEAMGPRHKKDEPLGQRQFDIAAALQQSVEEIGLNAAQYLHKTTGSKNVCMAGGVSLNCVMNGRILKETGFENIFVQPAAGDAGTAIGAALLHYYDENPKAPLGSRLEHSYHGPAYSDEEILEVLKRFPVKATKPGNVGETTASHLIEGRIIGWFQGHMEFGPRALGNRSILTAPFPAEMKDTLNERVKHREWFRPFAPAILEEYLEDYFDCGHITPYMLLVYNALDSKKSEIPATVHVDGTGRVQTVNKDQNPRYYDLIKEFQKKSGVPVILNTSFNVQGEPVVCTPEDAIKCFLGTEIDVLVLGSYIIDSKKV